MWVQLDPDDLLNAITQPERDLFGQGSIGIDIPDRLEQIIEWVTSLVRGKVSSNVANVPVMGPLGTIPDELYLAAIDICRFQFLTAFPQGKLFLDEPRMRGYENALKLLDDAANGTINVDPVGAVEGVPSGASASFGSRDDYFVKYPRSTSVNVIDFSFWH